MVHFFFSFSLFLSFSSFLLFSCSLSLFFFNKTDELLQTLVVKGFVPARNLELMQLTSIHVSMQKLVRDEPWAKLSENGRYIPPEWLDWCEAQLDRGIHGTTVLQILVKLGFRPERNPHLLQLLRASRGGTTVDPGKCVFAKLLFK